MQIFSNSSPPTSKYIVSVSLQKHDPIVTFTTATGAGSATGMTTGAGVGTGTTTGDGVASCDPARRLTNRDLRERIIAFVASGSQTIDMHAVITA